MYKYGYCYYLFVWLFLALISFSSSASTVPAYFREGTNTSGTSIVPFFISQILFILVF